jgi:hypothetical protein
VNTREWTYIGPGTAVPSPKRAVALDQDSAIEAMMSGAAKREYLPMVDTAEAEVVVRCVRMSLAATERRRGVGHPRERGLEEVTWCR